MILRNLSIITHLYLYACGKEEIKTMDLGASTMGVSIMESKSNKISRRNTKFSNENSPVKQTDSPNLHSEKRKEKKVNYDNVYNNDLYFCLDFNHFFILIFKIYFRFFYLFI